MDELLEALALENKALQLVAVTQHQLIVEFNKMNLDF